MPLYPALDKLAYQEPMLLDVRWVMSYAAGLKDYNKNAYFNTTKDNPLGPITAHPCLYWAISWPFMWNRAKEFLKEPQKKQIQPSSFIATYYIYIIYCSLPILACLYIKKKW